MVDNNLQSTQQNQVTHKKSIIPFIIILVIGIIASANIVKSNNSEVISIEKSTHKVNNNYSIRPLQTSMKTLENKVYDEINNKNLLKTYSDTEITQTSELVQINSNESQFKDTDIIAKGINGKEYTVKELVNKNLLLPYENNGKEIYFFGRLNENNKWEGRYLINVYKDNELTLIIDETYSNGVVKEHRQVKHVTKEDKQIWIVLNKVNLDGHESIESWQYIKESTITKTFDLDTVIYSDLITADTFKNLLNLQLLDNYKGNISNGLYNDNTGTAYYLKYDKFGNIETLYCGNFKNGYFEDNTNNAWSITRDVESNSNYMYYKGKFKGGNQVNNSEHTLKSDLTLEEINEYIDGREFNTKIAWKSTNSL